MASELDKLQSINEINLNEILNNMLDGSKDTDLKTEILKPKQLASLNIFYKYLTTCNLPNSAKTIEMFLDIYFRYMFSFNRKSRQEIIRAISYQMEIRAKNLAETITKKLA